MQFKKALILVLLLTLFTPVVAAVAEDTIRFTSVAEVETTMYDENGKALLVRSPAEIVNPGEITIYTNSFTNTGKQPAGDLVINNPVPKNTEYLEGSATEEGYQLTFSVDGGKTFGLPIELTVTGKDGKPRQAEAKDYTNIRWTKVAPLSPGQTESVEFRIRVK